MKKVFVLMVILSLAVLCACKNGDVDLPENAGGSSDVSQEETTDPSDGATIDWETPIDVDENFQQEIEGEIDAPDTNPPSENEPTTGETTGTQSNPTEPQPTQPSSTEPTPTQPKPTEPVETTRPGSSGPIELPMIPG